MEIRSSLLPVARHWLDPHQWQNADYQMRQSRERLQRKQVAAEFTRWLLARQAATWRERIADAALLEMMVKKDEALRRVMKR